MISLSQAESSELLFVAGIYFTFVMLISAISVSVTMLVLCVYHQAPTHAGATCIPVPRWVSTATCQSINIRHFRHCCFTYRSHTKQTLLIFFHFTTDYCGLKPTPRRHCSCTILIKRSSTLNWPTVKSGH